MNYILVLKFIILFFSKNKIIIILNYYWNYLIKILNNKLKNSTKTFYLSSFSNTLIILNNSINLLFKEEFDWIIIIISISPVLFFGGKQEISLGFSKNIKNIKGL